jgi:hypothetical protein
MLRATMLARGTRTLVAVALVSLAACEAPRRPAPSPTPLGKREVYGDAGLMPTRAGERARRELALAGELERALALLGVDAAQVEVSLAAPVRVTIVARTDAADDELEHELRALAGAMVPGVEPEQVSVWLRRTPRPTPPPAAPRPWFLMLACLGLGLSVGVGVERARTRRR